MKRILFLIAAIASILACLTACSVKEKPGLTDEQAEAILEPLLPKSTELMHLFFGEGLAYIEPETVIDYDGAQYEPVKEGQAYASIAQMRQAMVGVYSSAYQRDLAILMFEGYDTPKETEEGEEVLDATILPRYLEEEGVLKVDVKYEAYPITAIPSAKGAKVISGNASRVIVEIPYTTADGGSGTMRINLALDGGVWLLDGPTY